MTVDRFMRHHAIFFHYDCLYSVVNDLLRYHLAAIANGGELKVSLNESDFL